MAASNIYMNWTGVQFSYGSGTPTVVAIDEVTEIDVQRGGDVKRWFADTAVFAKAIAQTHRTRKVTIRGGAVNKLASIPENIPGTLVFILNDLRNAEGSGAITFTLANAVCLNNPIKGQAGDYAMGDIEFEAYSTDGSTDPLTYVIAP